jgi:hypothetical protein
MAKRKHKSDNEWFALIHECRISGLTDRQWCLKKGIPFSTFYSGIKRLKERSYSFPESTGVSTSVITQEVVPIDINPYSDDSVNRSYGSSCIASDAPALTLQVNGIRLEIKNHAHCDLIDSTIQAIRSLC